MTNKLTNLLRKVFLGSLAGIASTNISAANTDITVFEPAETDTNLERILNWKPDLTPKLILKKTSNNELSFMSHRSHRSHQSHRSHYSGQGTGHISHFSHYSSSTGGGAANPSPGTAIIERPIVYPNPSYRSLGSRTLSLGKSGTDVTELINILIKKKYITVENGSQYVTGTYEYDNTVKVAVKEFQKDYGLQADGICGPTTIYYLKNK